MTERQPTPGVHQEIAAIIDESGHGSGMGFCPAAADDEPHLCSICQVPLQPNDPHRLSVRNMEGLLQPQSRAEWDVAEHSAVFSSNLEALPIYHVSGKNLFREYLPGGLNGLIVGVVERGELRSFRISIEGGVAADTEVIPGHLVSIEVVDPNLRRNDQFPPPPEMREVVKP